MLPQVTVLKCQNWIEITFFRDTLISALWGNGLRKELEGKSSDNFLLPLNIGDQWRAILQYCGHGRQGPITSRRQTSRFPILSIFIQFYHFSPFRPAIKVFGSAFLGCGAPGCGSVWTVMVMASLSVSTRLMVAETVPRSDTVTLWHCDTVTLVLVFVWRIWLHQMTIAMR